MLTSGEIELCVDARILIEYEEVLGRPCFNMDSSKVNVLLEYIQHSSFTCAATPLEKPLPDLDDHPFLEIAIAGHAECLVTGNLKHYPSGRRNEVLVLSPRDFLDYFRKHSAG